MTESVIACVNQLGLAEPIMLMWTNCHDENISNGPLWDAMPISRHATKPSTFAEAIDENDGNVTNAESDLEDQTTVLDVADNITGVDDTQDVYEQWDKVVQDTEGGDVIDHIVNQDEVPVVAESNLGGVTSNWDQTPGVSLISPKAVGEVKVSPTDIPIERPTQERKPPNSFILSWKGKKDP